VRLCKIVTRIFAASGLQWGGAFFFLALLGIFGELSRTDADGQEKDVTPWQRQYKIKPNEKDRALILSRRSNLILLR